MPFRLIRTKSAVQIVALYAVLIGPMIAVLYHDISSLAGTIALVGTLAISFFAFRRVALLEQESQKVSEKIDEADQMKTRFISHVSHELKAPLAAMQETTNLLLQRIPGPLTEKQERFLQLNQRNGNRLASLLANLLDLSKLQAGIVDYQMQQQELAELIRRGVIEVNAQAQEKELRIVTNFPMEAIYIECDPTRIVQIFRNVIENAVRFSANGSSIGVRLNPVGAPPEHMPAAARAEMAKAAGERGYAVIAISDSGPGIEDLDKQSIFEPFYQAKRGKKTAGQSLGVGLAITRMLVEAHCGAIWVEDNPSGGSVFFIMLPTMARQAQALSRAS
jgi:two-component system sensor histidine kinase GlrK